MAKRLSLLSKISWIGATELRCWWRMMETKCVGDKFEMLVTDSALNISISDSENQQTTFKFQDGATVRLIDDHLVRFSHREA